MKFRYYIVNENYQVFGTNSTQLAEDYAGGNGWAAAVIDTENGTDLVNDPAPHNIEEIEE